MNSKRSLPRKTNFLKFTYEIFIKMKNNSYLDLLGTSNLSNETIKKTQNSHETIPLRALTVLDFIKVMSKSDS
jgi:hypothetical protein